MARKSTANALYRHGDVLIAEVGSIPKGAVKRPHLVLAEGEMTGHSHRIAEPGTAAPDGLAPRRVTRPDSSVRSDNFSAPNPAKPGLPDVLEG